MKIQKYWTDLLYALTEEDLKIKATDIDKLRRMDVIEFFQFLNSYQEKLDKKINGKNEA